MSECKACGQPKELKTPIGTMYLCFSKDGLCPSCDIDRIQEKSKACLGKYGETIDCPSCELYKPNSECYKAKWGEVIDNDDDCGMCSC